MVRYLIECGVDTGRLHSEQFEVEVSSTHSCVRDSGGQDGVAWFARRRSGNRIDVDWRSRRFGDVSHEEAGPRKIDWSRARYVLRRRLMKSIQDVESSECGVKCGSTRLHSHGV